MIRYLVLTLLLELVHGSGGGGNDYISYETVGLSSSFSDWTSLVRLKRSDDEASNDDDEKVDKKSWDLEKDDDIIDKVDISEEKLNRTLESQKYNINNTFDNHKYYKSVIRHTDDYWVDLNEVNKTNKGIVLEHSVLSKTYRQAAMISLSFKFPFYGHYVQNVTIATGGFLYTGDYVHSWLAATQYIAPLMANFDLKHETAKIRYADNGTALVVEWSGVFLNNAGNASEAGPFTFQAIVHDNGDIIFSYKTIPIYISEIDDKVHPVKVGLSDAYIMDRTIFFVRKKTIYEYHRVNLRDASISNSSAIIFKSLATCNIQKTCSDCLSINKKKDGTEESEGFECTWCQNLNRCSDGMDRYRQIWLKNVCDKENFKEEYFCNISKYIVSSGKKKDELDYPNDPLAKRINYHPYNFDLKYSSVGKDGSAEAGVSSVVHANVAVAVLICLIICLIVTWFGYAYFYPHTWSGQLLIKYRPTRWQWRRGEPRYTAASIHM